MKWFRRQKAEPEAPCPSFDEVLAARRSIRRYADRPVLAEALTAVLEAARMTPSSKGEQDFRVIAVRDADLRGRLAMACNSQHWVAEAPVVLVVYSQNQRAMDCGQPAAMVDAAIALSFMMLKAAELGLGTCWLGAFDPRLLRSELALPADAAVLAVSPLGWPDETPPPAERKPATELYEVR